jgi:arginine transport system permease protein
MTNYLLQMLNGLGITLILMFASVFFGFLLALFLTAGQLTSHLWIKKPIEALSFFIRGTPLLVQLFLIYYGSGQFDFIRESILWDILREPMACAIIALSLNTACYTSVLLLGAIHSVPKNEIDACAALGMSKWQAIYRIIFPIAFRIALPAYSNEVIIVLKCTSLASTITLLDLMGITQQLISQTYQTIQLYCLAGAIYLVLNVVILSVFHQIETRLRVNI